MMFAKRSSLERPRQLRRLLPPRRLLEREPFLCRRCHANFTLHRVCDDCRDSAHPGAAAWLSLLGDRGSYTLLPVTGRADPLAFVDGRPYVEQVALARTKTGP